MNIEYLDQEDAWRWQSNNPNGYKGVIEEVAVSAE